MCPLRKFANPKGDILHGMKRSDPGFLEFGEAYFSKVNPGAIKGWNRHKRMTLNLVVPLGKVLFVLYDDRVDSKTNGCFFHVEISQANYQRLTVPPGVWMAFRGMDKGISLVLNIADVEHDPGELEKLDLAQIEYDWKSVC